jgi:hypothetical protein
MTRNVTVLAAALLVACGGDKGNTSETGTVTDTNTNTCTNSVVTTATFPQPGATDVYYKSDVRFTLEANDATASITVTDGGGATVNGTSTVDGVVVSWTGDDFAPGGSYTATLTYACGTEVSSFTVGDTGEPLTTPADLIGSVYALDLASGQWVKPAGVGPLLSSQLGDTQIFVSPTDVTDTQITMLGGIGSGGVQDLCTPTLPFPPADFNNPYFELTSPLLPLIIGGFEIDIANLTLSGAFAPDASRIQGATLAGKIDTRPLGTAFDLGTAPDAVCQLVASFGVSCEDCDDGTGAYCLSVYIDNVSAALQAGTSLVPVSEDDIANNPDCSGS